MNRFILYIDILGFREIVATRPSKVTLLYSILNALSVHQHYAFSTTVFSDTVVVYNRNESTNHKDRQVLVMYACEFCQDLLYQLVGQDLFFRAVLVCGDFVHYSLANIQCFYGTGLIDAYLKEKELQAMGLFIDNTSNTFNGMFPTQRYTDELSFVYLNQDLDRLHRNTDGKLPTSSYAFENTSEYTHILRDLRFLRTLHRGMNSNISPRIRQKYLATWHFYHKRYPAILNTLEGSRFSLRAVCNEFDWHPEIAQFRKSVSAIRDLRNTANC